MRKFASVLALLSLLALLGHGALAASDPGHDTLYIEQTGNSSLTGQLNVSSILRVTAQTEVSGLILYGDGTQPGSGTYIAGAAAGTDWLRIDAPGNLYLKYGGGDQVRVGGSTATDFNVTGTIYQGSVRVCLANGTNCMSGNNTGNISSVVAGTGVAVTNPNGPAVTVALNTTYVDANYVGQSEYANLDTDSTNDLTTATSWGGDLGGTGSSPTVDDSSHLHDAANITTGTLADARIASAATWNAKAAAGASAACTYGIANITLSSSGVPAVTCAAQQASAGDIEGVTAGTGLTGGGTSGTVTLNLNTTFTAGYPNWNAAYTHVTTDVIETATDVRAAETDAAHDTCAEISGCVVGALSAESDPQVGTVTDTYGCYGTAGNVIACNDAGLTYAVGTDTLSVGGVTAGTGSFSGAVDIDGAISGNGKTIFTTTDSYLRMNEGLGFASGIWMANSNLLGGSGYLAMGSNGGTTTSRVYINGGTYNGANVISIDGSNGQITATQFNGPLNGNAATATNANACSGDSICNIDTAITTTGDRTLPKIVLDSTSAGDNWAAQGAYISLGESGDLGSAALHLTYVGDGYSYIGSGAPASGVPAQAYWRFYYGSKNIYTDSAVQMATIDTGNGAMEVNSIAAYLGDQNLRTSDTPTFAGITTSGVLTRNAPGTGYLSGNYATDETASTTGAIYTIGGSYYPTSTSLNTMYGIGYTHTNQGGMPVGADGWGLYVTGGGVTRVWLGADNGNVIASGTVTANSFSGSGSGLTSIPASGVSGTALTQSTTFGGDVSGTYGAIVVADNSHQHKYIRPYAEYTNYIANADLPSALLSSSDMGGGGLRVDFMNANGGTGGWATTMTLSGYTHYGTTQLAFPYSVSGNTPNMYMRYSDYTGNSWGGWVTMVHSGNVGSYADTSTSNEIQTLGTSGNTITLTSGGSVTAPYATSAGSATTATSATNADTVDNYHAADLQDKPGSWTCTVRGGNQGTWSTVACSGTEKLITGGCQINTATGIVDSYPYTTNTWGCGFAGGNGYAMAQCCY